MQGVDLVFQRLISVVAILFRHLHGVFAGLALIADPAQPLGQMFVESHTYIGRMNAINFINTGTTVYMAGHLGNDLSGNGCSGGNGLGRFNLRIPHPEPIGHHPLDIDQHTVEHGEERRVIQVMVVDITLFMSGADVLGQDVLFGIVLGHHAGQQIALGRDDLAVFIGVFVQQGVVIVAVVLIDNTENVPAQGVSRLPFEVAGLSVLNVLAGSVVILTAHHQVLNLVLNIVDIHQHLVSYRVTYFFCNVLGKSVVFDLSIIQCASNGFCDARRIKRLA